MPKASRDTASESVELGPTEKLAEAMPVALRNVRAAGAPR